MPGHAFGSSSRSTLSGGSHRGAAAHLDGASAEHTEALASPRHRAGSGNCAPATDGDNGDASPSSPASPNQHARTTYSPTATSSSRQHGRDHAESSSSSAAVAPGATPHVPRDTGHNDTDVSSDDDDLEDRCAICLNRLDDRTLLDKCFHSFCFTCICTWAKVARTCPLCKAEFSSVIHNIESDTLYEQEVLPPLPPPPPPRRPAAAASASARSSSAARAAPHGRPLVQTGHHALRAVSARMRPYYRRGLTPEQRRAVYAAGLRVRPETDPRLMRQLRDISPWYFRRHQDQKRRLVPWLQRELNVLVGADNADFVLEYVLTLLSRVDFSDAAAITPHLEPFLLENTTLFLHEFTHFARSPLEMVAYDMHATYDLPAPRPPVSFTIASSQPPPPPPPSTRHTMRAVAGGAAPQRSRAAPGRSRWDSPPPTHPAALLGRTPWEDDDVNEYGFGVVDGDAAALNAEGPGSDTSERAGRELVALARQALIQNRRYLGRMRLSPSRFEDTNSSGSGGGSAPVRSNDEGEDRRKRYKRRKQHGEGEDRRQRRRQRSRGQEEEEGGDRAAAAAAAPDSRESPPLESLEAEMAELEAQLRADRRRLLLLRLEREREQVHNGTLSS